MEEENINSPGRQSNNSKWVIIVVLVLLGIGVLAWLLTKNSDTTTNNSTQPQSSQTTQQSTSQNSTTPKTFSTDDVAMHKTASDCWMIISDKVYDVTNFVSNHPGGSEILRGCGIDATSLFTERETADGQKVGSGTPHSSSAENQLKEFYIGDLAN